MASKALAVIGVTFYAASAAASEWNGYLSVGSDYVYRGVSLLDSGPSLDGGIEGRFGEAFVVGASAARVDRQWAYQQQVSNHLQLDFYGGADFGCGAYCRARVLVSRYAFPGSGARDWFEATGSVSLFDRGGVSASWSPHGLGSRERTWTFESWLQQPLSRNTVFELGYGRVLIEDLDYWYTRIGVSHRIGRFMVDLSAHWSDHGLRSFALDDHNRRVVMTVTTGF